LKRVIPISDLHCGHRVGLTPPKYRPKNPTTKWDKIQAELWGEYTKLIETYSPVDVLIVNGDSIDGKGDRSGGTELLVTDRFQQCAMAAEVIKMWKAKHIVMTYGTAYHTGQSEDLEDAIAKEVKAEKIGGHEWIDVNGVVFDVKHFVGSSSVPYGKGTPISKERLNNYLWSEHDEQPKADVIIRSHIHEFNYIGQSNWLALTTPALQGQGSKFGSRKCSGHVDWGIVYFDVEDDGSYTWGWDTVIVESQKAKIIRL